MKEAEFGMVRLSVKVSAALIATILASCERQSAPATVDVEKSASRGSERIALDEQLLTGLGERRKWSSSGVKIHLKKPTVETVLTATGGKAVVVHAWGPNENDFNVAMMRLDSGPVLYAITEEEWREIQGR